MLELGLIREFPPLKPPKNGLTTYYLTISPCYYNKSTHENQTLNVKCKNVKCQMNVTEVDGGGDDDEVARADHGQ